MDKGNSISNLILSKKPSEFTKNTVVNSIYKVCLWSAGPLLIVLIMSVGIMIIFSSARFTEITNNGVLYTLISLTMPTFICMAAIPVSYLIKYRIPFHKIYIGFVHNRQNVFVLATCAAVCFICIVYTGTISSYSATFWLLLIHFFCIGLSEEILARGMIAYYLREIFSESITIVVSALIFAFVFHSNADVVTNLIVRFPLGLLFGYMTEKTKSIYPAVLIHWGYDIIVTFSSM